MYLTTSQLVLSYFYHKSMVHVCPVEHNYHIQHPTSRFKDIILLRYNSLPCGTECFTGCREAQTTNAREKQACSWFGLIGCRDVITSCVPASFSLVAAILDALLSFQSCFLLYLWIYCLSFVHNSAFPLFSSIESYTQFSALPVLYFVSFLTSS